MFFSSLYLPVEAKRARYVRLVLILGIAFVFGYFGIDKFVHPLVWIGWIPVWMNGLGGLSKNIWLQIIGCVEILSAVSLFIPNRKVRLIATTVIIIQLLGILTQTGWNDLAVRDISILLSAITLCLLLIE
ncbi:MAG: hypothetical protein JWM56_474 [Candidatus Peribacteria bacterium]|nr:hypothetical protein [Candidatus Peribacteria bacterium]